MAEKNNERKTDLVIDNKMSNLTTNYTTSNLTGILSQQEESPDLAVCDLAGTPVF